MAREDVPVGDAEQSLSHLVLTTRVLHHIPAGLIGTGFLVRHQARSWLVTASAVADSATLRVGGPGEVGIVLRKQRKLWTTLPRGGVAVMPFTGAVEIDLGPDRENTDGPSNGLILGFDGLAADSGPTDLPVTLVWTSDGFAVAGGIPFGYVGAPVVVKIPDSDRVRCLGVALPGADRHPVASLDVVLATIQRAAGA